MKEINIIVLILVSFNFFTIKAFFPMCSFFSNWFLDIRNENNTNEPIELRPGVLTKVLLILSHEAMTVYWDKTLIDKVNFTIASKDNYNIKFYPNELINLIPSESLEYSAYIGLSCNHVIEETDYNLEFDIREKNSIDGYMVDCIFLNINPVKIKINNNPTLINIQPIETTLTSKGFSLFKIENEIYNIEKFTIKPKNHNKDKFQFENIEIKPFLDRKKFGKNENDNHGILFEYKFGTLAEYPGNRGEINENLELIIDYGLVNHKRTCLKINPTDKNVNVIINEKNSMTLNQSIKETILNSMENVTPKKDKINNIQIKMDIPVAPILIKCDFHEDGKREKIDIIQYKDYILNSGEYTMTINNLNSNNEYKGDCLFSSTTFPKNDFRIRMGNEKDKDFTAILYPSRSIYATPQCVEFTLTSDNKEYLEEIIEQFGHLAEMLCNYIMNLDDKITYRLMGHFSCGRPDVKKDDKHNKNKSTVCIGRSPSFNSDNNKDQDIDKLNIYFSNYAEIFVDLLNSTENITYMLYYHEYFKDLQLVNYERYYDLSPPDENKIKIKAVKNNEKDKLTFKIISSNSQPIECFYNEEMKVDDTKKSVNLYHTKIGSKSVILYPNEENSFETHLKDFKENDIYTLFMNCYNLPGARIRYEQTGIFIAYTDLYGKNDEKDQSGSEKQNITIDCSIKQNKANPNCLKGSYNNLDEMLKTKMPETDENEELDKFNKLSYSSKMDVLDEKFNNFEEEIGKLEESSQIITNLINKEKMLIDKDCSIYADGSRNNSLNEINNIEYKKCRENKKMKQKKIIEYLKDNFSCKSLSSLIGKDGLSNNVEENIKYIILLIEEVTNNADSFAKGDSEVMLNMITCIQENYEDYWNQVKEYLEERGTPNITISNVKEDISNILINSMGNLVKILRFDEIDNYMPENEKNITSNGLMASKKGKKIHKTMKQFVKNFNEFGDGLYNLSDSLIINITINNDYKEKPLLEVNELDEKAIKYEDKGIILLLNPQSIMKRFNAYAMQIMNYDSPLISIKADNDNNESILNTFISITLYDNKGKEIKVDKIPENIRPKILYDKEFYKFMKNCYFYNEEIEDLSEKGVSNNDNYIYEGNEYLKCTAEHLTCFTAGNYFARIPSTSNTSDKTNSNSGLVTLIILGCILAVIIILYIIIVVVKKKRNQNSKDIMEKKIREIELQSIN
jgi:hypothetical protein